MFLDSDLPWTSFSWHNWGDDPVIEWSFFGFWLSQHTPKLWVFLESTRNAVVPCLFLVTLRSVSLVGSFTL